MRTLRFAAVAAAALLLLTGCSTAASDADPTATSDASASAEPQLEGELTVFAAASLKTAFDELATQFEAENPGVTVNPISYDGSSTLPSNASLAWSSRAVTVVTSKDDGNDKIHVVPQINFGSGQLDQPNALVFDGFGKILDFTVAGLYK